MKTLLISLLAAIGLGGCAIVPAPGYGHHGGGQVVVTPQVAVVPAPVVVRPWGYGHGYYGRGHGHYRY